MTILVPTIGEDTLLGFALGDSTPNNQTLKLYVNDYTPIDASVAGSFTEMTTHGYVAKTLTKTSWVVAQDAGKAQGVYADQSYVFTAAAAVIVYGYYVVDSGSGTLLWAERFAAAKSVEFNGDEIIITPRFTLSTEV